MNHILSITTDAEPPKSVVMIHIGDLDPKTAAMTVLKALEAAKPRKPRADLGTTRKKTAEQPPTQ